MNLLTFGGLGALAVVVVMAGRRANTDQVPPAMSPVVESTDVDFEGNPVDFDMEVDGKPIAAGPVGGGN